MISKSKDKHQRKKSSSSDDTVNEMRSWIRRIEQTTHSIGARLAAVEKRISDSGSSSTKKGLKIQSSEGPIKKIINNLKEGISKESELNELSEILDNEISSIQNELLSHDTEFESVEITMNKIENSIVSLEKEINHIYETLSYVSEVSDELTTKINDIERKAPPVMKIGNLEMPIEITGVIGGILAFILAILVFFGQATIITSPFFLIIIGLIFIGSAIFKMISSSKFIPTIKTNKITPSQKENKKIKSKNNISETITIDRKINIKQPSILKTSDKKKYSKKPQILKQKE